MGADRIRVSYQPALPRGFRATGVAAGIKQGGGPDLALLVSDLPAVAAATLTTNQVRAASVRLCEERRAAGEQARAVVINSGCANACTGPRGRRDAARMASLTARYLQVPAESVWVCSTGRIGTFLHMAAVERGIEQAAGRLSADGAKAAARAIMTTDTFPKTCVARLKLDGRPVTLSGMAKGAGMIEPNMATMLAFLQTDAKIGRTALQAALREAVDQSFNRISVDGDRSTNDTVLLLANGAAGGRTLGPRHSDWSAFRDALKRVTQYLALQIVRDGEGNTRQVDVCVRGARSNAEADCAARAVANSLLVKTSWVGDDANWGRIMDALGYSTAKVDETRVDIAYNGVSACRGGRSAGTPAARLSRIQRLPNFTLDIHLHLGRGTAVVRTCNCTEAYVRINKV